MKTTLDIADSLARASAPHRRTRRPNPALARRTRPAKDRRGAQCENQVVQARTLARLLTASRVVGGHVHDARIAAIRIDNGVREFRTADRGFGRFPSSTARDPLAR